VFAKQNEGASENFLFCDEILALLLVCCLQVHVLVLAWVARRHNLRVMSVGAAKEDPAPPAEAFAVSPGFFDVSNQISKTNGACASFLHSSCKFCLMNIVGQDRRACQLLLEHLL
jgi:hypothetical protein